MSSVVPHDFNPADLDDQKLEQAIGQQGDHIRHLKAQGADKTSLAPQVEKLMLLKEEKLKREAEKGQKDAEKVPEVAKFNRSALESVMIKRFFYAPSFAIYGGVAGLYDYGPVGCALQTNLLDQWRKHFVIEEEMLEVDCTNLTLSEVLKTSGHVDRFADYMVKDTQTGDIFRADHLVKGVLKARLEEDEEAKHGHTKKDKKPLVQLTPDQREDYNRVLDQLDNYVGKDLHDLMQRLDIRNPETGNPVTEPVLFNLMFETQIGPTGYLKGYLRPETAQGQFVNFSRLLEFNNNKLPFASASIGKSFRNEISPRAGLLRVREFTMAEIEHFVDPLNKIHPKFDLVKDLVLTLLPKDRQLNGQGTIQMSIGEAVEKKIIDNQTLGYFVGRINLFLLRIGINPKRLRFRQHMENEMAHYAQDCWDAEIESSYGWIECVGCADRSAYDLTVHSKRTGERLTVQTRLDEPIQRERWVLETNRSKFGPAFKKNAKAVQGYLDTLVSSSESCTPNVTNVEWDEVKLQELQKGLEAGPVKIKGTDGNEYELTKELVTITKKQEKISVREFIPSVIEPSFGIGRILYSLIEHAWYRRDNDEARNVFSFPICVAPYKALVLPLSNNDVFSPFTRQVSDGLRKLGISNKLDDSSASIGRRYARGDELGIPLAITVDFQTVKDQTVTLRERDSLKQIRESITTVVQVIKDLVEEKTTWQQVVDSYPPFESQEV